MKVTFDTQNETEVNEVIALLESFGMIKAEKEKVEPVKHSKIPRESKSKVGRGDLKPKKDTKPTPKPETVPEQTIGLAELKESAKNATLRCDRQTVRSAITQFGAKLADVAKADYADLHKALEALGV